MDRQHKLATKSWSLCYNMLNFFGWRIFSVPNSALQLVSPSSRSPSSAPLGQVRTTGCPGRTLIGPSCSVLFNRFSSCRFHVESGPFTLIFWPNSRYGLHSLHIHTCLLITPQLLLAAGTQWKNAVSIWSCALHLLATSDDRVTFTPVHWSRSVWHGPASCNHRWPME